MKFYVYLLKDDDVPFYVGKGSKKRMYQHYELATKTSRKSPVLDKIRKMVIENKKITYEILFNTDNSIEAYEYETKMIFEIGRRDLETGPLLNLTNGGEGVVDYIWTDSHRKNLSESIKRAISEGRYTPGRKFPPEYYNEVNEKISSNLIKFWKSEEGKLMKEHLSQITKGKKRILSDDARHKMSEGGKKRYKK